MKFFIAMLLLGSTLYAEQTISVKECLQTKYGHTLGGTIHSKKIIEKKLLDKIRLSLPHDDKEALIMIAQKYPDLAITKNRLIVRNCKAIYQGISKDNSYFFDAHTLDLIHKDK